MKLLLFAICAILAVASAAAQTFDGPETQIRRNIRRIEAAWNDGSGAKFASYFAENADYVIVNGMFIKGRKEIEKGHDQIFSTVYKGSVNTASIISVRSITLDVRVAHVQWTLTYGPEKTVAKAISSMVWVRNGDKWEITSFQNTPIQPRQG